MRVEIYIHVSRTKLNIYKNDLLCKYMKFIELKF